MRLSTSSGHWSSLSSGSVAETLASRRSCAFWIFLRRRIHLIQRHVVRHGVVGGEVRRVGEAIKHRRGRGVDLVHRRQAEHQFHRAQQAGLVVLGANGHPAPRVGAGDVGGRAKAAHVVPARSGGRPR